MPRFLKQARSLSAALWLGLAAFPTVSFAQADLGFVGPYMAARSADMNGDFTALVEYGTRALAHLPDNTGIMEGLVIAHLGLGDIAGAVPIARRLASVEAESDLAQLVLLGDAMQRENWDEVEAILSGELSIGQTVDQVILAWAAIGNGKMSRAIEIFDELALDPVAAQVSVFQKAQALAYVGDFEGAAAILANENNELQFNRSGIVGYVKILSQLDRNDEALALLDEQLPNTGDEEIALLRAALEAGERIPFDLVKRPGDGLSALFFSVGEVLASEASPSLVLIYSRLSEHLAPQNYGASLLSANVLETMGNYALAVEAYDAIGRDSPAYIQAQMQKSTALHQLARTEEMIATLTALTAEFPDISPVHVALGDAYRYEQRWPESVAAYDDAIALYLEEQPAQWAVYFARGIAQERSGDWDRAEADFRKALALQPDQPSVLNYLGYSYVEKRQRLDEALDMIEKAVQQRPDQGYIVDSLAWALFRLGRYDDALPHMERAVALMPDDSVLNDHLGDVYWAVGRTREAEFQWMRALNYITDDTNIDELKPDRVRRKLEVGLDKVLAEDGAEPLQRQETTPVR